MDNQELTEEKPKKRKKAKNHMGGSAAVYGLGFIGAAVYHIQQADAFWVGVLGVLKAVVWPAMVVYKLLAFLS